jgi:L-fuconolactonase
LIDAHQHFWNYDPAEYEWIDDSMASLRRNFLPPDLSAELVPARVGGTVAVQARQTLTETKWLLELAEENSFIRGVVGWAPIADPAFPKILEELASNPKLAGLRHVVQAEPEGFLTGAAFNHGIAALGALNIAYDILIVERQLPEAIEFVDHHPGQTFVLDHIAKPRIAESELEPWGVRTSANWRIGRTSTASYPAWLPKLTGIAGQRPRFSLMWMLRSKHSVRAGLWPARTGQFALSPAAIGNGLRP